jgi:hypothetical protein
MNTHKQLLPRTILFGSLGIAAMLLVSTPSCKAQEVSPDHFTDTGVQDVYDGTLAKAAVPAAKHNLTATQARTHQTNSSAKVVHPVAKNNAVLSAQLDSAATTDKRKLAVHAPQKQ